MVNVALDIPLLRLFHSLGLPAYYGAITATLACFLIANGMSMHYLNKEMNLNYKETIKAIPRFILSSLVLVVMLEVFKHILPVTSTSRLVQLINILVSGLICGGVYLLLNFKSIISILPEKLVHKLKLSK